MSLLSIHFFDRLKNFIRHPSLHQYYTGEYNSHEFERKNGCKDFTSTKNIDPFFRRYKNTKKHVQIWMVTFYCSIYKLKSISAAHTWYSITKRTTGKNVHVWYWFTKDVIESRSMLSLNAHHTTLGPLFTNFPGRYFISFSSEFVGNYLQTRHALFV